MKSFTIVSYRIFCCGCQARRTTTRRNIHKRMWVQRILYSIWRSRSRYHFQWQKATSFSVSLIIAPIHLSSANGLSSWNRLSHFLSSTDSSSVSNSDSDSDSENIFYSTYHEAKRAQQKPAQSTVTQSSTCSFRLSINQGLLSAYSPVRDSANRVIPGQQGEFVIKLQSGSLFSVSSFRGDENLNYMCVQAAAVEMYHIGLVPVPSSNPPLRLHGCVLPNHVQSTIYATPPDLTVNQAVGKKSTNREMISIAVQVKSVPERKVKVRIPNVTQESSCSHMFHFLQRIKVSAGVQLATLRYNSALPEHSWLRHIMDMFNVEVKSLILHNIVDLLIVAFHRIIPYKVTRHSPTLWRCIYTCGTVQSTIVHDSTITEQSWQSTHSCWARRCHQLTMAAPFALSPKMEHLALRLILKLASLNSRTKTKSLCYHHPNSFACLNLHFWRFHCAKAKKSPNLHQNTTPEQQWMALTCASVQILAKH